MFDRLSWLLLIVCLVLPIPAQAQEHSDQTNAVVVFAAEGQFRFSVMVYMRRHIHQSLKDMGVHPLAGMPIWEKLPKPRYPALDTCIDEAHCLERIRSQVDAQHIMLVSIARTKGEPFAVRLRVSGPAGQGRSYGFEEMKLWPLYQTTAQAVKDAWTSYQRGEREVLPEPVEGELPTGSAPVLVTSSAYGASPTEDPVAESRREVTVSPVAEDASEPSIEPVTEDLVEAATKSVTEKPAEPLMAAVGEEVTKPTVEPVTKDAAKPATKPVTKEAAKPATEPVMEDAAKPATEPVTKDAAKPATEPVTKDAAKPATEPVTNDAAKPATEPVTNDAAKPATEPVMEDAAKPATEPVPAGLVEPAAVSLGAAKDVRTEPRLSGQGSRTAIRRKPRPRRPSSRQSTSAGGYKVSMVDLMDAGADWSGGYDEPEAVADEWTAPESTEWEGDVVIKRLEDLEELAGYAKINGSVTIQIGSRASLEALWMLEVIDGDLRIEKSPAILDLRGLEQLSEITGSLIVSTNASLLTLKGLNNVGIVGGDIVLDRNGALIDVEALTNIRRIHGQLSMTRNRSLWSLSGFRRVAAIGGDLTIADNGSLMDLMGLDQLQTVGGAVVIERNDALSSLNGLSNLTRVGRGIAVTEHESLRDIARLESLESVTGDIAFISNPVLPACSVDIFEYSLGKAQMKGNVVQRLNDDRTGCGRSSSPGR